MRGFWNAGMMGLRGNNRGGRSIEFENRVKGRIDLADFFQPAMRRMDRTAMSMSSGVLK